jgi:large subunit ribosomal protein L28
VPLCMWLLLMGEPAGSLDMFPMEAVPRGAEPERLPQDRARRITPMAAVCEVCGKHPSWGMSVSHSHRRTKRRWNPNIQRVRALVNGAPKRVHVCTGCIKAGKITKVVAGPARDDA